MPGKEELAGRPDDVAQGLGRVAEVVRSQSDRENFVTEPTMPLEMSRVVLPRGTLVVDQNDKSPPAYIIVQGQYLHQTEERHELLLESVLGEVAVANAHVDDAPSRRIGARQELIHLARGDVVTISPAMAPAKIMG